MMCPVCGGALRSALPSVADPQTGQTFAINRCERCALGVTVPIPEDLGAYYGTQYYGGRHWITRRYCAWRRMRVITQSTRAQPTTMVDIGCGDGSFLLEARAAGWSVIGTEVNDRIPSPGLEIWGSIADLKARAPFGCITLWHSLEHLKHPAESLTELAQLLVPGGTFVVAVPNNRGWQARLFGRHWLHLDVPRHLSHFGPSSLDLTLARAGLESTRVWHHEVEYDWFGWIQSSLNVVMPQPNILFDAITRRPRRVSRPLVALNIAIAALLFAPAFVATVVSTWASHGGTIIVAARRPAQ
jgi:SAM-dependent methyltransferase